MPIVGRLLPMSETSERKELRDFIQSNMHCIDGFERWTFQAPVDLADALLAAGWQKGSGDE